MLLGARQFFARKPAPAIPYDAEVEYLESTGTQYIDTGCKGNTSLSTIVEVDFMGLGSVLGFVFGSRPSSNERYGLVTAANGYGFSFGYRGDYVFGSYSPNTKYSARFVTTHSECSCSVGTASTVASDTPLDTNLNIYMFTRNWPNNAGQFFNGRIFCFTIYQIGVKVREFQPVRFTNEQNQSEGAMYDRVSGQLFRNAGTGAFLYGPDKS